jgi:hypothetical protein
LAVLKIITGGRIVNKYCFYNANMPTKMNNKGLNLALAALVYQQIDLCFAFYITMDDVTVRPPQYSFCFCFCFCGRFSYIRLLF